MKRRIGFVALCMAISSMLLACQDEAKSAATQRASVQASGEAQGRVQAAHAQELPLPSEKEPLRLVLAQLQQRAAAGDAPAACRLGAEYQYCGSVQQEVESMAQAKKAAGERSAFLNTLAAHLDAKVAHCSGVDLPSPSQRVAYWRQAAMRGHVPSIVHYASGRAFGLNETLELLPELAIYREQAPRLIQQAAQAGSADAILVLARAYSPRRIDFGGSLLAQLIKPDAKQALIYLYLARAAVTGQDPDSKAQLVDIDREIAAHKALLSEHAQAEALQDAERRKAEWRPAFNDMPVRGNVLTTPALMPDLEGCGVDRYIGG